MKKLIFISGLILSLPAFSQVTEGKGTINGTPISWNIDIFAFLENTGNFPDLKNTPIYYFEVASQKVNFPEIKNDQSDYQSTDRSISVTSLNSKQISIKPNGQLAKTGDLINIAYNQKLKLYIPSTGQYIWIGPKKKNGIQVLSITKEASESDRIKIMALEATKISNPASAEKSKAATKAGQVR